MATDFVKPHYPALFLAVVFGGLVAVFHYAIELRNARQLHAIHAAALAFNFLLLSEFVRRLVAEQGERQRVVGWDIPCWIAVHVFGWEMWYAVYGDLHWPGTNAACGFVTGWLTGLIHGNIRWWRQQSRQPMKRENDS